MHLYEDGHTGNRGDNSEDKLQHSKFGELNNTTYLVFFNKPDPLNLYWEITLIICHSKFLII